ncbi:MAG: Na+/H+ antiporter [Myxococcales bacterium]|nr:Na+/H+ antiporter [Myxococcales bacterium]MCB9580503.1 Na+/H+ antiporter [Polyangiaceae bacterium]
MHTEVVFVALFGVAAAVALMARRLRMPYTVALVAAGLLLGHYKTIGAPHLTKSLLYAIFLPGLLFEAAYHLEFDDFWRNKVAIHALAIPGLLAAIGLTAVILTPVANALHFVQDFELMDAAIFASLIAATDPIAVVGLFKTMGAPRRLSVLVEGESLLNDGTAVVVFAMVLSVATGTSLTVSSALLEFARVAGLGLFVGALSGYGISKIIQRVDDPMIEITLTSIAAYGSFLVAEELHVSGVIATVVAGMLCGNYAARTGMSPTTRIAVESFWEYVAFALNSIVFLLVGLEVHIDSLLASWKAIIVAWLAVMVARAVVMGIVGAALSRTRERVPPRWAAVLTWGGLRGALSMVLVLSLPQDFEHRELLVNMTFGVVLISILVQGVTMSPLLTRLGLVEKRHDRHEYETRKGALLAANAALAAIEQLSREHFAPEDVLDPLRKEYEDRVAQADANLHDLRLNHGQLHEEELEAAKRRLLLVEKDELLRSRRQGVLTEEAFERLIGDVDARLHGLEMSSDAPAPQSRNEPAPAPASDDATRGSAPASDDAARGSAPPSDDATRGSAPATDDAARGSAPDRQSE